MRNQINRPDGWAVRQGRLLQAGSSLNSFSAVLLAVLLSCSLSATSSHASPIINEVYYDQPGGDGNQVFTELWGIPYFDLSGWSLQGINGNSGNVYRVVDLTGSLLNEQGLLVISGPDAEAQLHQLSGLTANIDWQNGSDAIQLLNPAQQLADALQYGTLPGFTAGEGLPAEDASAGLSLSRRYAGFDSQNNQQDFILTTPSPGTVVEPQRNNVISVSNSPSHYLLLLGLLPLWCTRQRRTGLSGT